MTLVRQPLCSPWGWSRADCGHLEAVCGHWLRPLPVLVTWSFKWE